MSVTAKPFRKWDLERWFYTDPLLSKTDRAVARQILAQMDERFQPRPVSLKSQAFIGGRVACWRESVNRSLRKLVTLGYFSKTLITVQRKTKQGIKGVTRVLVSLGRVTREYVESRSGVSPVQPRSVMSHHSPRTPLAARGTVGGDVVANSADRKGSRPVDNAESRRRALAEWPRLAGQRPITTDPVPRAIPMDVVRDPAAYAAYLAQLDAQLAAKIKSPRR